jgi:hypothetical protein
MLDVAGKRIEDEVPAAICCNEKVLAVVGELDLSPFALLAAQEALLELLHVPHGKRGFVVVAHIVQQHGLRGGRGDGHDGRGGVVRREVCAVQVQ